MASCLFSSFASYSLYYQHCIISTHCIVTSYISYPTLESCSREGGGGVLHTPLFLVFRRFPDSTQLWGSLTAPPPPLRRVFPSLYLLQFGLLKPGYTCCKSLSSAFVWSNWEGKPHSWAGSLSSIESVTSGKHYANAAHLSKGVFEFRGDLAVLRLNEVFCNNLPSFG